MQDFSILSEEWASRTRWFDVFPDVVADGAINLLDYSVFSRYWGDTGCGPDNDDCQGADLFRDGSVNIIDLWILSENWLKSQ
jgi:hypothetical protein